MQRRPPSIVLALLLALTVAGGSLAAPAGGIAAAQDAAPAGTPSASPATGGALEIALTGVDGAEVGTATFTESADGVTLAVSVEGLEPGALGIHLHASGVCDPSGLEPFSTAGPHSNPTGASHGGPDEEDAHAGDLGNLTIGDDGTGTLDITSDAFTLADGPTSLFDTDGSTLVIHAQTDDLVTDPTGLSGGRIACGLVAEPGEMPTEAATEQVAGNVSRSAQMPADPAALQAPEGFEVSVFASGLTNPRMMLPVDDATVLVTQPGANQVSVLRDGDDDGVIDVSEVVASNLPAVHGITLHDGIVYLAGERTIWTATLADDGTLGATEVLVPDLPIGGQHGRNTVNFGPDGMLYVSLGSTCNVCIETDPEKATIVRMTLDGSEREVFASGLRNTLGWDWHPETGELWGMDMGSDWRGDDLPPDELNLITEGGNYGWPFCFGTDATVDTYAPYSPNGATPDQYCGATTGAVLEYQAHSSPVGWVYSTGDQFPEDYQGDAFIAFRGSWNREPATGYAVVRVQFENGQPVAFEDFVTGWLSEDGQQHSGRIAGLTEMPDGSLLIADDTNGVIYRVSYGG